MELKLRLVIRSFFGSCNACALLPGAIRTQCWLLASTGKHTQVTQFDCSYSANRVAPAGTPRQSLTSTRFFDLCGLSWIILVILCLYGISASLDDSLHGSVTHFIDELKSLLENLPEQRSRGCSVSRFTHLVAFQHRFCLTWLSVLRHRKVFINLLPAVQSYKRQLLCGISPGSIPFTDRFSPVDACYTSLRLSGFKAPRIKRHP